MLMTLPAAVLMARTDGVVTLANHRAAEILGVPTAQLVGRPLGDILPLHSMALATTGHGAVGECPITRGDGSARVLGYRISHQPGPPCATAPEDALSVVFQDVTELAAMRTERDRLLQVATVGQVLPSLLHEIKNPLAGVNTALELLLEDAQDSTMRTELHAILGELRRVRLGLEGMGTLGRTLRSTRHHPVDHEVREAFRVLEAQARSRQLDTECHVDTLPLLLLEPGPLRAMVFNLVSNAIHACSPGHRIRLDMNLQDGGTVLQLCVSDTGKGMAPDVLARCRELFFTTRQNGSGIGLALCTRCAQEAGGTLDVDSAPGRGTRVTVRIPLGNAPVASQGASPGAPSATPTATPTAAHPGTPHGG